MGSLHYHNCPLPQPVGRRTFHFPHTVTLYVGWLGHRLCPNEKIILSVKRPGPCLLQGALTGDDDMKDVDIYLTGYMGWFREQVRF